MAKPSADIAELVESVGDMYLDIDRFTRDNPQEREIAALAFASFPGFDGKTEHAHMLLAGRDSQRQTLKTYARMLAEWRSRGGRTLARGDVLAILAAAARRN
jgi:hypothetical protein